jgi:hypothetical protein
MVRTLVVGDIHGCLREFERLLSVSGFRQATDRLVLCGDLVDRGPDSAGVLRLARHLGAVCALGNHEEKHLRYWRHFQRQQSHSDYVIPMRKPNPEVFDTLTAADFDFIAAMPLVVPVGPDTVVVHGGFAKGAPRWRPTKDVCRVRYVDPRTRKFVGSVDGISQPESTVFWTDKYLGTKNVIYGHHIHWSPKLHVRKCGIWTLGIDTGCYAGGSLTGYWVEERRFVSVRSSVTYTCSSPNPAPVANAGQNWLFR